MQCQQVLRLGTPQPWTPQGGGGDEEVHHLASGGFGIRKEVNNEKLLSFIREAHTGAHTATLQQNPFLLTVCTGAALAAKAGLLKGKHATTNKVC